MGYKVLTRRGEHDFHAHLSLAWIQSARPYGPFLVVGFAPYASPTAHPLTVSFEDTNTIGYYGQPCTAGLLVKNGSSCGEPQAHCNACGGSVALSYGTAYYRLKADRALFEMAVRALAEGNALRATARIVQVDKDTVCAWLDR